MIAKCPFHNTESIHEFDALDENARANPWPYYDWLREHFPDSIYKLPHEKSFYVIHRYEDVKRVFNDHENFNSKIIPTVKSPFFALMDGNDHTRIRGVVSKIFTPAFLDQFKSQIKKIVNDATNDLVSQKNPELFKSWADKIPLSVLSILFGLKTDENALRKLHNNVLAINKALFVVGGTGMRRSSNPSMMEKISISFSVIQNSNKIFKLRRKLGSQNFNELLSMFRQTTNQYEIPRPDYKMMPKAIESMLDLMLHFAEVLSTNNYEKENAIPILRKAIKSGDASLTEMMMAATFIIFAGYETTSSVLSNSVVHLTGNKTMEDKIRSNSNLLNDFVEEVLRYYTPVGRFLRRVKNDIQFNDILLPKGALVLLLSGSANTDTDKFIKGCEFDMERENSRQHLSFGKGPHFCIGAPLARLQIQYALNDLLMKTDQLKIDSNKPLNMVVNRDNGILRFQEVWMRF